MNGIEAHSNIANLFEPAQPTYNLSCNVSHDDLSLIEGKLVCLLCTFLLYISAKVQQLVDATIG